MRQDVIQELVTVLHKHDDAETYLINLARERGCKITDLSAEEKADHDKYEYLSMDLRAAATDAEYAEAIRLYDPS